MNKRGIKKKLAGILLTAVMMLFLIPLLVSASGADVPSFTARVTCAVKAVTASYTEDSAVTLTFTLSESCDVPVTFDYTVLPGSAGTDLLGYSDITGTVTFGPEDTEETVTVTVKKLVHNPTGAFPQIGSPDELWNGTRVFYISCTDIQNALFTDGAGKDCWELVVPVKIQSAASAANLQTLYTSATCALLDLGEMLHYAPGAEPPYEKQFPVTIAPDGAVRKLLDAGVLTSLTLPTISRNNDSTAEPVGIRLEESTLHRELYTSNIAFPAGGTTLRLGSVPLGSFGDAYVPLGPMVETNGMVEHMELIFTFPSSAAAVTFGSAKQLYFSDNSAPTIIGASFSGDAQPLRAVPIIVIFSEPVSASGVKLTVTSGTGAAASVTELPPVETSNTVSNKLSFLYTVGDSVSDLSCYVSGGKDLSGKEILSDEPSREFTLSNAAEQLSPRMLLAGLSGSVTVTPGTTEAMEGKITLSLKENGTLITWVSQRVEDGSKKCTALKARVVAYNAGKPAGTPADISLYADNKDNPTQLAGSFTAPVNGSEADVQYYAEIYYTPDGGDAQLLYPLCTAYTVPPLRYIDSEADLTLTHPGWPLSRVVRANEDGLSMGYACPDGLPTWNGKDYFKWSSSDAEIATIDEETGAISLTGMPGIVRFTLTVTDPIHTTPIAVTGEELTVRPAGAAFLRVPDALRRVEVPYGNDAIVSFSSDLIEKNAAYAANPDTATVFTLTLYAAANGDGGLPEKTGSPLWTETVSTTAAAPRKSLPIPAAYLTSTSAPGVYGYVAEVSAVEAKSHETLTDTAYLRVLPQQARPVLTRPQKLYMTDEQIGNATVRYTIENYSEGNTEYELIVRRNSETDSRCSENGYTQSVSFNVPNVGSGEMLDAYTVSLKARNSPDHPWAYDSYTFYVYNADALKPQINGITERTYTLTLPESIAGQPLGNLSSYQLVSNRANLVPDAKLSLNADYPWSTSVDQFTCAVTGGTEGGLLLKLREGGAAQTLTAETLCSPNSSISLVGVLPGNYVVTTTHVLTGARNTISVTVEDISNNLLYLKNTQGVTLTVSYGDKTETAYPGYTLAIYDPEGFGGITITPADEDDKLSYKPTVLYPSDLRDNQRIWAETGVYPITQVTLKEIPSTKQLTFYTEDRDHKLTTYNGYVKVSSGIYSYNVYIPDIFYADKKPCDHQRILKTTSDNIRDSAGWHEENYITLDYDRASMFNSYRIDVENFDALVYGFELIPCDKDGNPNPDLLPVLTRQSGDQFTVVFQEKAESWLPPDCSLISQSIYQYSAERDFTDIIYLDSDDPWDMRLVTRLLVPKSAASEYTTYVLDETGAKCMGSNYIEVNPYGELCTLVSLVNIGTAYINSMYWNVDPAVKTGEILRLYPVFSKKDGSAVYSGPTPVRIQNLFCVPSMETMERYGGVLSDMKAMVFKILDMENQPGYNAKDDNTKKVLSYLEDMRLGNYSAGLALRATDDPLVYEATFRMAVGNYASSNPPGVFMEESEDNKFSFTPEVSDMKAMAKGTFLQKSKKEFYDNTRGYRDRDKLYGGGIYAEGIVYYDVDLCKWCYAPYSTAAYLGGGIKMERAYNFSIGPIPCTTKVIFTGTAETGLKVFTNRGEGLDNAYIMSLLPAVTLRVSGGVGADAKIVSLWAGPYGQVTHRQHYLWQNWDEGWSNGQKLTVSGEAGVEVEISFLFFGYEDSWKLVSYNWNKAYNDYDKINKNYTGTVFSMFSKRGIIPVGEDYALVPVGGSAGYETRDYLTTFERKWESSSPRLMGLSTASELTDVLTNAYPQSAPVLTQDGVLMAYLDDGNSKDLNKTAASFALRNSDGSFSNKGAIDADPTHPDSNLTVAGTASHAAAAWVRSAPVSAAAGAPATDEDLLTALTGTEIVTSVYNGTSWTTTTLTDDERLDMAPAVAASDNHAVVAWLSATPCDMENPLAFSDNRVMVSFHNGTEWSTPAILLDAVADSISGISAVMLPDGGAAVSFLRGNTVVCATLDASGAVISLLHLAEDAAGAAQMTAAKFPDETTRYVIGWNAAGESGVPILRLAAVNADGTLYPDFSVALAHESGYDDFKFSKGTESVTDLSVLWSAEDDSESSGTSTVTYPTVVFGQKLTRSGESYFATAPQELLRLSSSVRLRSFDAVTDDGDIFRFVLTASELLPSPTESTSISETTLSRATAGYQTYGITVEEPFFDYAEVRPGGETTVQFSVTNDGLAPITKLVIAIDGNEPRTFDGLSVASGETELLSVICSVPNTAALSDADYTVTAHYGSDTAVESGTLPFALPDIRMDELALISESGGERQFNLTLGIPTYAPPTTGQSVLVQASATSDFAKTVYEHTLTADEITDLTENGCLRMRVTLDLNDPAFSGFLSDGELPEGGLWLYFRTVLKQDDDILEDADSSNDHGFRRLLSLAEQMGRDVSLGSALTTSGGTSTVRVSAFNNTLRDIENGNLVVSLLDANGDVLETKQTYTGNPASLISIDGEDAASDTTLAFTQAGAAVDVRFARVTTDSSKLSVLNLTGVPLTFAPETVSYTLQCYGVTETLLTAVPEDPDATVTATLDGEAVSLTSPFTLPLGEHTLVVTVTGSSGSTSYTLQIKNSPLQTPPDGDSSGGGSSSTVVYAAGGGNRAQVSASVRGSTAELDFDAAKLEQLFDDGAAPGYVTIDLTGLSQSVNAVRIGADDWQALSDAANSNASPLTGLTLVLPTGRISLDSGALSAAAGGTVTIRIAPAKQSQLTPEQQKAARDRPVFDVTVLRDKEEISDLKGGGISISVPYTLRQGEPAENVAVWHLANDGTMTRLSCVYDAETKSTTFTISHLSLYVLGSWTPGDPFVDVKADAYYYDAVRWAVEENITMGTADSIFSPNAACTRAQIVTFLWRAAGRPEPAASSSSFTDVKPDAYYYTAALWAANKGITLGTNADGTAFSPNDICTREQMAVFLYRYAGSPAVTGGSSFTDVAATDYCYNAVLWAASAGITQGTNAEHTTFSPKDTCTRAQIVTFLYRYLAK